MLGACHLPVAALLALLTVACDAGDSGDAAADGGVPTAAGGKADRIDDDHDSDGHGRHEGRDDDDDDDDYGVCSPTCETDFDCCEGLGYPPQVCAWLDFECRPEGVCASAHRCDTDQDCVDAGGGDSCRNEFGVRSCFSSCEDDADCTDGQACDEDEVCRHPEETCQSADDPCPLGHVCDTDLQMCVQCVTDADCGDNASGGVCAKQVGPYYGICLCQGDDTCGDGSFSACRSFPELED